MFISSIFRCFLFPKLITIRATVFLISLILLSSKGWGGNHYSPGHDKDDGGFLVFCSEKTGNSYSIEAGYYSLDYLYGLNDLSVFDFLEEKPGRSFGYYLSKVESILIKIREIKPGLLKSFQDFRRSLFSEKDWREDQSYYWDRKEFLNPINTDFVQRFRTSLPSSCMEEPFRQAIRREVVERDNGLATRILHYDPKVKNELEGKPLQLSMLLVHEWLWDFVEEKNLEMLMRVNKILHSKQAQFLSSYDLSWSLDKFSFAKSACGVNPAVGTVCSGGALYAGQFNGGSYMVTPPGCTDSEQPECSGEVDIVRKNWSGVSLTFLKGVSSPAAEVKNSLKQPLPLISGAYVLESSAVDFCDNMVFGGYSDWYLPSDMELEYIYCLSSSATMPGPNSSEADNCSALHGGKEPNLLGFAGAFYWSSSSEARHFGARAKHFGSGVRWSSHQQDFHYVRCIRRD